MKFDYYIQYVCTKSRFECIGQKQQKKSERSQKYEQHRAFKTAGYVAQ